MPDTDTTPTGHTTSRPRSLLTWLLAPATEEVPRHQAVGALVLRLVLGMLWLYNVNWKRPPDFGEGDGGGLYKYTEYAVTHPVFPPYSWVVENLVLPNFTLFGYGVLLSESLLAVLVLTGSWVRLAALLGIAQSVAIALSVAVAPNEWPWSYWLMIGAHVVLLLSSAGRLAAVDTVRDGGSPRGLLRLFGGLALVLGLYSGLRSLGDPLAAGGPQLGSSALQLGFGGYNLLGALVLLLLGGVLLALDRGVVPVVAAYAAAAVAAVAALVIHVQVGSDSSLFGGMGTSASVLLSLALVAVLVPRFQKEPS